jgi:hypothetical protein
MGAGRDAAVVEVRGGWASPQRMTLDAAVVQVWLSRCAQWGGMGELGTLLVVACKRVGWGWEVGR